MAENKGLSGIFGQFNKPFWVVNAFELFERGAYYGTMSVLGVHVTYYLLENDPSAAAVWGALYAMLIILLYFLPLISAALAEKYGYRNVLFVCYGLMLVGYFTLSAVRPGNFGLLIFSFFMIGIGAGAFKPIISATIAHVTGEEQRNLAYSIYYWMINLGATLVPLSIGLYTFFTYGVSDEKVLSGMGIYYFVGILSGILVVINTLILIFLFRDPVEPNKDLSVGNAFKRIAPAFKDKKFVVLLVIYSGFWFMFAYNHTFLPVLMVDFARMPDWFQLAFLATINPGTIIILGPFLGKFVEKYKSLNIMMTGILIFCLGLAINGFSNTPALFVIGIIIFSIGEFITHPGFISYVSKIAPKDKVTIYMGSIFISTGLGNAVGGIVHGFWYNYFARALFMPQVYVSLVIVVGLITLICFIFYNKWMISETLKADPEAKVDRGFWTKPITAGVVCLFIPITIGSAFFGGTFTYYAEEEEVTFIFEENVIEVTESGYTNENNQADVQFDIPEENYQLTWINCSLTWQDEGSSFFRGTNEPDEFKVALINPNGDTVDESSMSTSGSVSLNTAIDMEENLQEDLVGTWIIVIEAGNCGDDFAIGGFRSSSDNGNDWLLEYSYTFLLEKKK
jgi:MFS family permease